MRYFDGFFYFFLSTVCASLYQKYKPSKDENQYYRSSNDENIKFRIKHRGICSFHFFDVRISCKKNLSRKLKVNPFLLGCSKVMKVYFSFINDKMKVLEELDNEDDEFNLILADEATHQLDQDAIFVTAKHNHHSCDTKGK